MSTSRSNSTSATSPASSSSSSSSMVAPAVTTTSQDSAMNSFIQELRNLSSSSSASSNSSFDSGFSASFTGGDSNGGSGRATATNSNHQQPNIIWGNKSLWGRPPPSPSPAAKTATSTVISATESTNINNLSNSMYATKEPQSSWNSTVSPSVPSQSQSQSQSQSPHFPQSIWENSTTNANESMALSGTAGSTSLGSIWMIPDGTSRSVWGEPPVKPNSQLLRPTEIGATVGGAGSSNSSTSTSNSGCGSKLSSLWAPSAVSTPPPPPPSQQQGLAGSGNVLKSLRLAGTVGAGGGSSSSFGLGGLTTTPTAGTNGGPSASATAATTTAAASLQLFSDEFLSYLNINN
ncbi:serine-rich adhesin for platelets-like [Malaya genurostris]|uniref:serine-rich adhesin for platelets-like n=1 Tax=Malaya genurostris TaxID=325434 RepID=UPI0026F3DC76|nr:serine-rich adhesin for platelets-like [Malaya genurostris]